MVPAESPCSQPKFIFMPLIIALCIIVSVVLALLAIHSMIIKFCMGEHHEASQESKGVDKKVLETIQVYAYTKNEGHESLECSVCLGELEEGDSMRALPNCGHVFHVCCIDAWLVHHSTCPFCRSGIFIVEPLVVHSHELHGGTSDDTSVVHGFSIFTMVREKLMLKGALIMSFLAWFSSHGVEERSGPHSSLGSSFSNNV
ncbi:putative transcription factor C2H2 family [Dioscorea sansibarensis]